TLVPRDRLHPRADAGDGRFRHTGVPWSAAKFAHGRPARARPPPQLNRHFPQPARYTMNDTSAVIASSTSQHPDARVQAFIEKVLIHSPLGKKLGVRLQALAP